MKPFHGVQCGEETEQVAAGKMATRAGRCVGPWGGAGSCGENFLCTIVFSIIFLFLYNEEIMFENLKPSQKSHFRLWFSKSVLQHEMKKKIVELIQDFVR